MNLRKVYKEMPIKDKILSFMGNNKFSVIGIIVAFIFGFINICKMGKLKWTYESCLEEAKKYTKYNDFQRKSQRACEKAIKNGWDCEYYWLERKHIWDKEEVISLASEYKKYKDFCVENQGAYFAARNGGYTEEIKKIFISRKELLVNDFFAKLEAKFPNRFDISKVNYINSITEIDLICKKCGHVFHVKPTNVLQGDMICKHCMQIERANIIKEKFGKDLNVEWKSDSVRLLCIKDSEGNVIYDGPYKDLMKRIAITKKEYIEKYYEILKPFADKANIEILEPYKIISGKAKFKYKNKNNGLISETTFYNQQKNGFKFSSRILFKDCIPIIKQHAEEENISIINDVSGLKNQKGVLHLKCNICGYEWKTSVGAFKHQINSGCAKCKNKIKYSTSEVIDKFKKVHGDKYNYSKVEYINSEKEVCIICPTHGEFFQKPYNHWKGFGCPKCNVGFNINDKLSLLESVDLENMSDHQLIELIGQDILPREFKILTNSEGSSKDRKNDIKRLKDKLSDSAKADEEKEEEINKEVDELEQAEKTVETIDETNGKSTEIDKYSLPELTTQELKTYDKYFVSYGEKNAYISKESINKIWNCVLSDEKYIAQLAPLKINCGEWLKYIIDTFLEEYKLVKQEQVTEDYKFEYEPSLMQKLMSYRIATNPYYGNWCGTGAGKTNAFLIASRRVDARVTVCVCPNSVVDTIRKSIIAVYPNSNIVAVKSIDDIVSYNREQYNYIIFNYEKFSQTYSQEMVEKLVSLNTIDFICFDEVHRTKNNESSINQSLSNLRILANEKNKDLKVLGMTATPLINNLCEVRNLLELITGTSFAEIIKDNKCTINNIHNAYKYLMLYGFRYVPDYSITCKEEKVKIISGNLTEQLVNFKNSDVNDIEGLFVHCKYNSIKQYITNRTIIYTQFIKKLMPNIKKELKNDGITFREYTGENSSDERDGIITDFGEHKFDVILASSPITTGVDGLQKYCDNIIIMSLPWTNAEYTQLIGRVNRQGSNFKQVNIIIPQVFIELKDGKMWSWDEKRYNIIKTKRTLSDAVVDGRFASVFNLNRKKLLNDAIQSLKNGITDFSIARKKLEVGYSIDVNSREYKESVICNIHQKANTSTSKHMNEFFNSNPNKWREYHSIREENKKEWVEDPITVIAEKLNRNNHQVIADLGCGMNQLKTLVSSYSQWYSFDHYSDDNTVIKADISDLQEYLQDNSVDAAVFCMSLWGTNYMDYIKEAYRYLKSDGIMYVTEPKDKINQAELIGGTTQIGFEIISLDFERNGKTYIEFQKVK